MKFASSKSHWLSMVFYSKLCRFFVICTTCFQNVDLGKIRGSPAREDDFWGLEPRKMTAKSNEKSHWNNTWNLDGFSDSFSLSWELLGALGVSKFHVFFSKLNKFHTLFPKLNLDFVFLAYWAPRRPWVASTAPFGKLFGMILGLNRVHRAHLGSHLGRFCRYFWYCGLDFFQFLQSAASANSHHNI